MNQHIYLRAYMAGIVVPTFVLLFVATAFTIARYVYNIPVPVERVIVFPMAVVPNAWGLWNVLFVALRSRLQLSLGLHGALLPILLAPLGIVVASLLNFSVPGFVARAFPVLAPVALLVYYFAWKYLVGFFNRVQDIA
jgi:ABC-type sulfate transport system permease subunit